MHLQLHPQRDSKRLVLDFIKACLIVAGYFVTGKYGLTMDPVSGFATIIWAPSGIALAALLLYGFRFWPAVTLAAFLVNFTAHAPFWSAWGVAAGNTLEAVVGAWLLQRFADFKNPMDRIKDVVWFLLLAAGLSTLISPTIGVLSLVAGNVKTFEGFGPTWAAWWAGDSLGDVIVAPMFLVWATANLKARLSKPRLLEIVLLATTLVAICILVFGKGRLAFLIFPVVVWAALRFGQIGSVSAVFVVSLISEWGVTHGFGPFVGGTFREDLLVLFSFLIFIAATGMTLAASIAERKRAVLIATEREKQKMMTNEALRRTQAQLQEAIKSREEFLSIASHELKTPITSLSLHIEMTKMEIDLEKNLVPPPHRLAEVFSIAMKQIDRLASLVEDLLDVSRIQAGKLGFNFEKMNLSELVKDMVHRFAEELAGVRCPVNLHVQDNIIIDGDAMRLEQVMDNLVSNVIKYAPGSPLDISLKKEDSTVKLVVEDQGPGIAKGLHPHIFERFERGSASKNIGGLGLGFFIVKEIVRGHHGTIHLDSDVGKGVKMIIDLPASPTL